MPSQVYLSAFFLQEKAGLLYFLSEIVKNYSLGFRILSLQFAQYAFQLI